MSILISVVEAVQAVEAVRRIPKPQRPRITYFSYHDIWLFQARVDNRTCELCLRHEEHEEYHGNHLRLLFPHLEIKDDNTIEANVHPNCRCYLVRLLVKEE